MDNSSQLNEYKKFDPVLQKVNSLFINPSDGIIREYKAAFVDFFHHFKKNLCLYDTFLKSYQKIEYTDSYRDDLLIANTYFEFNGAILIRLPKDCYYINECSPGYVNIMLEISNIFGIQKDLFQSWIDENNYIVPNMFRSWANTIMSKSLANLNRNNSERTLQGSDGIYLFSISKPNPPFTMHVKKKNTEIEFDVDISLCLEFVDYWPISFKNFDKPVEIKEWLAEPKEPNNDHRGWRYKFPKAEKLTLANCYHMKSTIRFIKKLCNKNEMPYLTSYHIKNIFLWEIHENIPIYWQESLGCLLVRGIVKIQNAIEIQKIPFYWDSRLNLLSDLEPYQIIDCQIKLKNIMKHILNYCTQNSPDDIIYILLRSDEINKFHNRNAVQPYKITNYYNQPHETSSGDERDDSPMQMENVSDTATNVAIGAGIFAAALGGLFLYRHYNNNRND